MNASGWTQNAWTGIQPGKVCRCGGYGWWSCGRCPAFACGVTCMEKHDGEHAEQRALESAQREGR